MTIHSDITSTLSAPLHLRGDMRKTPGLTADRAIWIRQALQAGHSTAAIAAALGIGRKAVQAASRKAGVRWTSQQSTRMLRGCGIRVGSTGPVIDAMPREARVALADHAARARKPMSAVLGDFWTQYHGAFA